jgi:hypothetical protein
MGFGNVWCHSVEKILSSDFLHRNTNIKLYIINCTYCLIRMRDLVSKGGT